MSITSGAFTIRPMRHSDLDQVRAIAKASPEAPQWQPEAWAAYLQATPEPPIFRRAVVAEGEGKILGFAAATLLVDGEENLCQLESVAVDPSARRRGIATTLVRDMLGWVRQNGGRRFSLEVRAGNAAAIALYLRLGLEPEGRRTGYYADPEEDALVLGTPVTAGEPNSEFPP